MDNHDPKSAPTQINSQTKHQQIIQLITQAGLWSDCVLLCIWYVGEHGDVQRQWGGVLGVSLPALCADWLVHANKFVPSVYFGTISYYPKEYFKDNFNDGGGAACICFCHGN